MPRNAAEEVRADHIVGFDELPLLLVRLLAETVIVPAAPAAEEADSMVEQMERPVALTCPDCGGAMRRTGNVPVAEFRCIPGTVSGSAKSPTDNARRSKRRLLSRCACSTSGSSCATK